MTTTKAVRDQIKSTRMENTRVTQTQQLIRYNKLRGTKDQPESMDIVVPRQGYDVLILHAQVQRDNF